MDQMDGDDNVIEPLREIRDGYLMSLSIGTPPQVVQVYMDTGSDLTWVPCGNLSFDCQDCEEYQNNISGPKLAAFLPTHSSTSIRDTCGSSFCMDIHSSDNPFDPCTIAGCSLATLVKGTCPRPCPSFAYTYGASGVVTGSLTRDVLFMHGNYHNNNNNNSNNNKQVPRFCFGCVGATYREPIGIAGFGRGLLSLPFQLGFSQKGFSHCFLPFKFSNNPNFSSPLILGHLAISSKDENLQFTPLLKSPIYPNYYYIGLESITIGNGNNNFRFGVSFKLREIDTKGNGGMLIDSGTTYTHLPEPLYSQLISNLESVISYPRAKQVELNTGFDLCYKVPCKNNNSSFVDDSQLPSITFHFLNNVSVVLPQGNNFYAMAAPINSTVVKCLLYQSMDGVGDDNDSDDNGPAGIFGSFQQQNLQVVYDLEKERLGFQAMDCVSVAANQGLHKNVRRNMMKVEV
ncbi:probable aspartyl protease At4g16563 [Cucumis melo]|nr:probable aspartyl protease At4g16563 [Cucumis melo]